MLESLQLTNFQKHEALEICFGDITTIIGPSDVGKSSIVRALRWVLLNKPQGDFFIRDGAKCVTVSIKIDGHKICRERGTAKNTYVLDNSVFEVFRNNVPEEIFGVSKISDINFQLQHDAPFWFSESAGEISRKINELVSLDVMDRLIQRIGNEVRERQQLQKFLDTQLEEILTKLVDLDYITQMRKEFLELEAKDKARLLVNEDVQLLDSLLEEAKLAIQQRRKLTAFLIDIRDVEDSVSYFVSCSNDIIWIETVMKSYDHTMSQMPKKIPDIVDIENIETYCTCSGRVKEDILALMALVQEIDNGMRAIRDIEILLRDKRIAYKREFPNVCPLCGKEQQCGCVDESALGISASPSIIDYTPTDVNDGAHT